MERNEVVEAREFLDLFLERDGDGGAAAVWTADLDELELLLNIRFDTNDAVTLGGFLIEQLQHLPKKGERITYKNYIFQIQKSTEKRIVQVLILKEKDTHSSH